MKNRDMVVGIWRGACYVYWVVLNSPEEKSLCYFEGKGILLLPANELKHLQDNPMLHISHSSHCRFGVPVEFQGLFTTVPSAQRKKPRVPGEFAAHCPPATLGQSSALLLTRTEPKLVSRWSIQVVAACWQRKGQQGGPCRAEIPSFPQPCPAGREGGSGYHSKLHPHFLSHRSSGEKKQKQLWKPTNLTVTNHKTWDQLSTSWSARRHSAWLCLAGTACVTVIRQQSQHLELINWFVH